MAVAPETLAEVLSYYDRLLAFGQRYFQLPGIQVAVYAGDEIAYSGAYGHADVAHEVPLTERHLFRIASHSKTVTATVAMQLVERGQLRLDDQAATHVPEVAGTPAGKLTVRELLSHAGGLTRNGSEASYWQLATPFPDRERLLAMLLASDAAVIPGNVRFKYSNIGFGLLGLVIEAAAGMPFNDYARKEVVAKLGLSDFGPELDPARRDEFAVGYSALACLTERVPIDQVDTRALGPATGFYSTARDLVSYFAAHLPGDDRLLSEPSKRQLHHPLWQTGTEDGDQRYGLGMQVVRVGKRDVVGHGGLYPGHTSRSMVDPERRIVVSVMINAIDGPTAQFAQLPLKLLDLAESNEGAAGDDLSRFTGRFGDVFGMTDIALLGGRLYQLFPDEPDPTADAAPLERVDDTTVRVNGGSGYGAYGESFRYTFDDSGIASVHAANGMVLHPIDRFTLPDFVTQSRG